MPWLLLLLASWGCCAMPFVQMRRRAGEMADLCASIQEGAPLAPALARAEAAGYRFRDWNASRHGPRQLMAWDSAWGRRFGCELTHDGQKVLRAEAVDLPGW